MPQMPPKCIDYVIINSENTKNIFSGVMKMGTKYKFLKYTLASSLLMPLSFAATSGSSAPSGSVAPLNEIVINSGSITITEKSGIDGSDGSFTGTDFMELEFQNNDPDGYTVKITPTKGFLQNASLTTDGGKINYTLACDAYNLQDGSTQVSAHSAAAVTDTSDITIYNVSTPAASTNVCSSGGTGCQLAPDCDLALGSGEDVDELFAGTYTDTFTVAIANKE